MKFNSYRGNVFSKKADQPDGGQVASWQTVRRVLFFPALFVYLELVLQVIMGGQARYWGIHLLFAVSAGLLCSACVLVFPKKVNCVFFHVLTLALSLIYAIEFICKRILQSYFPFSTLGLAAGNRLSDYSDVILSTVLQSAPNLLLFLLPALAACLFGRRLLGFAPLPGKLAGILLAAAVAFHLGGLGVLALPWSGDLTPKQLYHMDTSIDDQVEQLGLLTMLRRDICHSIVPPKNELGDDFSDVSALGGNGEEEEPPAEQEPPFDTSPNVMDVDLAGIADQATDADIQWLAQFFNSVTPTLKNEYTGLFKGYNVIFFTLEGFSGYAIDPELTPTLYKLANEGFVFKNYYTPLHFTSTSGGECQNLLGLYPKNGNPATMRRTGELGTNAYFSLAQQLGREGYQTLGYHGNYNMYDRLRSHTNLGYVWKQYEAGLDLEMGSGGKPLWPQRDQYVIDASVGDYINSDQPFHVYYLTISGHMPYGYNRVASQYRDIVEQLDYSDTTRAYIATAIEVDRAMQTLLKDLEAAGKLENTLIVASADHIPYFNVDTLEELTGEKFGSSSDLEYLKESEINFDLYRNTLMIWSASMDEPIPVEKVCGQVDILPTVSNLLGLEYDSRMLAGADCLAPGDGLVIFTSQSWQSDQGFYNRFTQEFTPAPGNTMTQEQQEQYVSAMRTLVKYKQGSTERIVESDFYDYIFGD